MIISAADTFTSALAGVTVFAILGNLAHQLDVEISKVVAGPGLAFESRPYAIAQFNFVPQVSVLQLLLTMQSVNAVTVSNIICIYCVQGFALLFFSCFSRSDSAALFSWPIVGCGD